MFLFNVSYNISDHWWILNHWPHRPFCSEMIHFSRLHFEAYMSIIDSMWLMKWISFDRIGLLAHQRRIDIGQLGNADVNFYCVCWPIQLQLISHSFTMCMSLIIVGGESYQQSTGWIRYYWCLSYLFNQSVEYWLFALNVISNHWQQKVIFLWDSHFSYPCVGQIQYSC